MILKKLNSSAILTIMYLVFLPLFSSAQNSQISGDLKQGAYPIGFTTFSQYDLSRPPLYEQNLLPADQQIGRPVQINVWYPSQEKGKPVSLLDYFKLTTQEVDFKAAVNSLDELVAIVQEEQTNSHGINLDTKGLKSFLEPDIPMEASHSTTPANGKFPLIIIGPETAFKWCIIAEYLASYGYVVVTTPMTGSSEKLPDFERTLFEKESFVKAMEASITDLQFATGFVKSLPYVDETQLGLLGYSSNVSTGIGLITRGVEFNAIVSLEGSIGGYIGGEDLSMTSFYSPYEITQPLIHIFSPAFGYNDFWMQQYKYADRTLIATYDIRHDHLTTYGVLDQFIPGISGETKSSPKLALETAYLYTLNFFDYHLKKSEEAEEFINNDLKQNKITPAFQQDVKPQWRGIKRFPAVKTFDEHELNKVYLAGDFERIRRIYKELSTVNPQPFSKSTFFNFGRFLKSTEEKEIWYSYYVESYDGFSEPYFLLAQEKQRLKKNVEAIKNYDIAWILFNKTDHILLENIFTRVIDRRLKQLRE